MWLFVTTVVAIMTNFIRKVKEWYGEHRIPLIVGAITFLGTTIAFALGLIVGEELVAKTPLVYTHCENTPLTP